MDPIHRIAAQEVRDEVSDIATYLGVPGVEVIGALVVDSPAGVISQYGVRATLRGGQGVGHEPCVHTQTPTTALREGKSYGVVVPEVPFAR